MNPLISASIVQVADRPSKNAISVGGAILVVPSAIEESQRLRGETCQRPSSFFLLFILSFPKPTLERDL